MILYVCIRVSGLETYFTLPTLLALTLMQGSIKAFPAQYTFYISGFKKYAH